MMDLGHVLFALCLWGTWYNHLLTLLTSDRMGYDRRLSLSRSDLAHPIKRLWSLATLPYLAGIWAFTSGRYELWAGLAMVLLLLGLRRATFAAWPDGVVAENGKYVPTAAALMAYLLIAALGSSLPPGQREALAWEGACGVLGAAYLLSAIAKLQKSGWAWASSGVMGLLMAERAYGAGFLLRKLRVAAVNRPAVCSFIGRSTLLVEAGAIAFVYAPMRLPVMTALLLLHLGIALLMGYLELEWMLLVAALTLLSGAA